MENLNEVAAFVKSRMRNFKITFTKLVNVKRNVIENPVDRPEDWYSLYKDGDTFVLKFCFTDEPDSKLVKVVNADIVKLVDEIATEFDFSTETVWASKAKINRSSGSKERFWEFNFNKKVLEKIKSFRDFS